MKHNPIQSVGSLSILAATLAIPVNANALDWVVRKNSSDLNCYIQRADSDGSLAPRVLGTFPSKKLACEKAKALFSDDVSPDKCQAYTQNSKIECGREGIDLRK